MVVLTAMPHTNLLARNKTQLLGAPQLYVAAPDVVFHQKVEIPNNQCPKGTRPHRTPKKKSAPKGRPGEQYITPTTLLTHNSPVMSQSAHPRLHHLMESAQDISSLKPSPCLG